MSSVRDHLRKLTDRSGAGGATSGLAAGLLRSARDLRNDLVDRNLWPVALLLCVAIVAIPVVLSRGGDAAVSAPAPAPAPQVDGTATNAIELVGPPTIKSRPGTQVDPFRQPAKKKTAATSGAVAPAGATPSAAAAPSAGSPSAASPSAAAPSGGTPSTGAPSADVTPVVNPASVYYRTEVRWSLAAVSPARPISRLTPLGDTDERGVLYLGVSNLGYAMFLLSPNAQAEATDDDQPGKLKLGCVDTTNCRLIALKTGASQVVMVPPADGGKARRYHLQAVSAKRVVTTVAAARRMRAKEHSEGRALLRELASDPLAAQVLDELRYDAASGLLVLASGDKKTTK
jgi:hypothetical protein